MRVAAGAIAKKFLQSKLSIEIDGYVSQIGKFKIESFETSLYFSKSLFKWEF